MPINQIKTILFLITLGLVMACGNGSIKEETLPIPDSIPVITSDHEFASFHNVRDHPTLDTFVIGNFDKDKIKDTAFVYGPMEEWEMFGCNPCITSIVFSNGTTDYKMESDVSSYLENLGDLDQDGVDELGHLTSWFNGGWTTVMVLKKVNNEWLWAAYTEMHHPDGPFNIKSMIKKKGNGKILIYGDHHTYSEPTEKTFDLKADSLPCLVDEKKFEDE